MFTEQGPCQSFASIHDVSKVYHPVIRLINGTTVEQRTWLKCKYPKRKWLCWITGNYKVSSWDLPGWKWLQELWTCWERCRRTTALTRHTGSFRVLIKRFGFMMLNIIPRGSLQANLRLHPNITLNTEEVWPKNRMMTNFCVLILWTQRVTSLNI